MTGDLSSVLRVETKICGRCKVEKPRSEFGKATARHDGLQWNCLACTKEFRRANVANGNQRRWNAEHRARLKHECFMAYGGYVCACCGETEVKFLTIDHVDGIPEGHRRDDPIRRRKSGTDVYRDLKQNGWPKGYAVLCMNCNWAKGQYGACPHETGLRAVG